MRNSETFNKVVNFQDGEIQVLCDLFKYNDGVKGATGSVFYAVSKKQYKERTSLKALTEYLSDCVREEELKDMGYRSYVAWAKAIRNADETEQVMFDTSYSELWDYLRDELNLSENEAFIFECVGGGRIFYKDFQGNKNPELSELIREYENQK